MTPRLCWAAERSLLVVFGENATLESHRQVRRLFLSMRSAPLPGTLNLHPAYASLLVDFADPDRLECVREIERRLEQMEREPLPEGRVWEIPVRYGGSCGPDLEETARYCRLNPEELISRHSRPLYLVHFLGFSPGFPYLAGLDSRLAAPRLASPRVQVPAGSVAIGGSQTGIYPMNSPGGWRLIGRTPWRLFDPRRNPPALLEIGDSIRFIRVEEMECAG